MNKTKKYLNQTDAKGSEFILSDEDNWLSPPKRKKSKFMCAPLSFEEEQQLATKIQQGDEQALIELYQKNIPFVQYIAEDYFNKFFDKEEIVAEGRVGLYLACTKFKPNNGARFSTYAKDWINRNIKRYIATKARIVNTSNCTYPILCKFLREKEELTASLDREPTNEELIKKTGLPERKVRQFMFICHYTSPSKLASEKFFGSDDSGNFVQEEVLLSEELNPIEQICENEKLQEVREAMNTRFKDEPRTLEILQRRFGFNNNKIDTLEEISKDLKITRERVRQLEEIALKTLRQFLSEQQIYS